MEWGGEFLGYHLIQFVLVLNQSEILQDVDDAVTGALGLIDDAVGLALVNDAPVFKDIANMFSSHGVGEIGYGLGVGVGSGGGRHGHDSTTVAGSGGRAMNDVEGHAWGLESDQLAGG